MSVKTCGQCAHFNENDARPLHSKFNVLGYLCTKRDAYYVPRNATAGLCFEPRAIYGPAASKVA